MSEDQVKYRKKPAKRSDKKNPPAEKTTKSPFELIEMAIKNNATEQQLAQVIAYKERYDAEAAKKAFTAALATFQSTVPDIVKNRKKQDYSFASLDDIDEVIKKCLFDNGFTKRWELHYEKSEIGVTCVISHTGGHKETTTMWAPADKTDEKNDVQARGSTVSYLERYTLAAALGLTIANQDNDASGSAPAPAAKPKKDSVIDKMLAQIEKCSYAELKVLWENNVLLQNKQWFRDAASKRKTDLLNAEPLPEEIVTKISSAKTEADLTAIYNDYPDYKRVKKFIEALSQQRTELGISTTAPKLP